MSGIAGILRSDGRAIPEHWVRWLEESLALRGSDSAGKFHDTHETARGTLEIILLHQQHGSVEQKQPIVQYASENPITAIVIDGVPPANGAFPEDGSFAAARWDSTTMELHLARGGSGQQPLYMLDLGAAGDGVVFCSIPTPLLWIAKELALHGDDPMIATQRYLQLGYITGDHTLLAPVRVVPLQQTLSRAMESQTTEPLEILHQSRSPATDLDALMNQLGQPFADTTLLPRYWMYQVARKQMRSMHDDSLIVHDEDRHRLLMTVVRWHWLLSFLPDERNPTVHASKNWMKFGVTSVDAICSAALIQRITGHPLVDPIQPSKTGSSLQQLQRFDRDHRLPDCVMRGVDACAMAAGLEVYVVKKSTKHVCSVESIPLAAWLTSAQSEIGLLAGDLFHSSNAFQGLPIDRNEVIAMLDDHRSSRMNYSQQLFALLTLGLWLRLGQKP